MATYSLASYILTISNISSEFGLTNIQIGGQGSMLDSITLSRNENLYETVGDPTGGYVHNKNLNKTGTIALSLSQLSANVGKFITLVNIYARTDITDGLTITLVDTEGNIIATCTDCFPQGVPEQTFAGSAGTQNWQFTCGKIDFS